MRIVRPLHTIETIHTLTIDQSSVDTIPYLVVDPTRMNMDCPVLPDHNSTDIRNANLMTFLSLATTNLFRTHTRCACKVLATAHTLPLRCLTAAEDMEAEGAVDPMDPVETY